MAVDRQKITVPSYDEVVALNIRERSVGVTDSGTGKDIFSRFNQLFASIHHKHLCYHSSQTDRWLSTNNIGLEIASPLVKSIKIEALCDKPDYIPI